MRLGEVLGTQAMLATVVAVAAACDIIREDTGLIAAIVVGLGLANLPGFDIPARRPFFETVIQLIIGVLFVSISASVTPDSLKGLVLPTLGLVAVLVLVARPLAALVATLWTSLSRGERGFIGWMAPRGIVAASTATILSATLVADGIGGAEDILPVTFLVIVMTVTLYGLTAAPAARLLGVMRSARTRPLLVGGVPRVVDLGRALQSAGLEVLMWAGLQDQRDQLTSAGLERASGGLLATATSRGAELEGVTAVLLLTDEDDFNALASATLQANLGRAGLPRTGPPRQPRRCRPLHRRRGALRRPVDRGGDQQAPPPGGRDRDLARRRRHPRRLRRIVRRPPRRPAGGCDQARGASAGAWRHARAPRSSNAGRDRRHFIADSHRLRPFQQQIWIGKNNRPWRW